MKTITFLILMFMLTAINLFSQTTAPQLETGVSHALAKWRAANYSDVRYKLNITLEKGAPLMKGEIEISVNLTAEGAKNDLILDWRWAQFPIDNNQPYAFVTKLNMLTSDLRTAAVPVAKTVNDHLILPKNFLKTGENTIKIEFASPIKTSGSAITRYVDKEDGAEYLYSLFVPSDASTAFPVFDQPDLKARFQLNVLAPREWKVIANTNLEGFRAKALTNNPRSYEDKQEIDQNKSWARFLETKPISTYVFAFAAGEFAEFEDKNNSTASRVSGDKKVAGRETSGMISTNFSTESATENISRISDASLSDADDTRRFTSGYSLDALSAQETQTSKIYVRKSQAEKFKQHSAEVFRLNREGVKFLESYFDYKFPFPKYDLVLIPEFPFGGMEHAGATFLRETSVIFPTEPTKNDYVSRANLIFHEAAHQWFGDTVTMKWFDDLWLKEGFAEFMAYKTLAQVMPEYNAWKIFYERNKQAAYLTDSTKGTTPIYQEIPNLSSAKSAYGNIVYRKAPSFLKQAEFYLGEKEFQTAARAFLKKYEFKNAEWTDLVQEFETASKQDLKDWANVWVKQKGLSKMNVALGIAHSSIGQDGTFYSLQQSNDFNFKDYWKQKVKIIIISKTGERKIQDFSFSGVNVGWRNGVPTKTFLVVQSDGVGENTASFQSNVIGSEILSTQIKPEAIFPNYQDYGYGIFLLDEKSRAYVLENIQNEKDDFLRAMMWGSLWDSVREGELDPKTYVELVIKVLSSDFSRQSPDKKPTEIGTQNFTETDESTIQTLLGRVGTAMNYYLTDKQREELAPKLETLLIDKMQNAPTLGQRITFYRAFLNTASSENARRILKTFLLDDKVDISRTQSFQIKTKDKFDIVTRLLILGDADAPQLLAELEKAETSDEAKRYAYAAKAGIATAENKAKFWNDFVNNKEISESWIEVAFVSFNSPKHADLTLIFLERALNELPDLKRNRKIFFVNGWLAAFIGGQKSEQALAIINKFLADNPNLDKDLRLKILENSDNLERGLKIRAKFKT